MTSENTVKWHKFPKEKPTVSGTYLVTIFNKKTKQTAIAIDFFHCAEGLESIWFAYNNNESKVKAWAELPNPFGV